MDKKSLPPTPGFGRPPVSTYRLQFHAGFRFADAHRLVPYLEALGITDCYASPYLRATPGSSHGYDVCSHSEINPEVGSEAEHADFSSALAAHGMGQIGDFVPNHVGVDPRMNPWWRDVLENGPCSPYAKFFDIDWRPAKVELREKVLLPILGDQYGAVLERGELQLHFDADQGTLSVTYFEHDLPINPRQFPRVLEHGLAALQAELGEEDPQFIEYLSIVTALHNLPAYTETEPARVLERHREKEVARQRLQDLVAASPRVRRHIEETVRELNGRPGRAETFDTLHGLLEAQPYRLSYWRTASHEINYRRFFDINQLAGLRMDEAAVFAETHALVLRWIAERKLTGLRLDHVDGLFDPAGYLARLQAAIREQRGAAAGTADSGAADAPFYLVVEKILSPGEALPPSWPVAGTTGYEFLNEVNGLFVDRSKQRALLRVYRRFTGLRDSFADVVYESKKLIMDTSMASELNVLAHALNRLSEANRRTRDFTLNSLRDALHEVVACFPIYRTYVSGEGFTGADRAAIDEAIGQARRRNPAMEASIFDFLRAALLPATPAAADGERAALAFAMKFQQYTGPVQAKGVEDTAFYRYNALGSLNDVGGAPERFGCTPQEFHLANAARRERWPATMLATSTHDTKRGEDVRARLNVLSEIPEDWGRHLSAWKRINASNRSLVDGEPAPDRNDEYLFYQTLLGVWPAGSPCAPLRRDDALVGRLQEYMLKAVREAKRHTSWITVNEAYEAAVARFVERALSGPTAARFFPAFAPLQERVARLGMLNSLAQLLLKAASPGTPDFYQGTELWDLTLVDPDNRRPVDHELRRSMLDALEPLLRPEAAAQRAEAVTAMLEQWHDGRIKLFLTALALRLRRTRAEVFLAGEYLPLRGEGECAHHVVALARRSGGTEAVFAVPRLAVPLTDAERPLPLGAAAWGTTTLLLPPESAGAGYTNLVTGAELRPDQGEEGPGLPLAAVFHTAPVAVLIAQR